MVHSGVPVEPFVLVPACAKSAAPFDPAFASAAARVAARFSARGPACLSHRRRPASPAQDRHLSEGLCPLPTGYSVAGIVLAPQCSRRSTSRFHSDTGVRCQARIVSPSRWVSPQLRRLNNR